MCENKYYKQAREELEYLSGDPDFQRLVESRAGFLMDQAVAQKEREEKGKAEGEKKKQLEIAKKMKAKKMSIEEIIELTELPKEEIEKL